MPNNKHLWNFNIRNTVLDYVPGPAGSPEEVACDHINAMCYLLDSVPYSVVYGPADELAATLLAKIRTGNPGELNRVLGSGLVNVMDTELQAILGVPDVQHVQMWTLYTQQFTTGAELAVTAHYQTMKTAGPNLLCIPFLRVQGGGTPVPESDMMLHMNMIRNYCVFDIFTKSKKHYPALHMAVAHGKSIGAMSFAPGELMEVMDASAMVIPPLNDRKCVGGTCQTGYPNNWCNVDANGNCTTGS